MLLNESDDTFGIRLDKSVPFVIFIVSLFQVVIYQLRSDSLVQFALAINATVYILIILDSFLIRNKKVTLEVHVERFFFG